jgi:starch phosphorylase
MRESMARLTLRFSANRAVREYTDKYYLPAAAAYVSRTADKGVQGRLIADWRSGLEQKWAGLRFGGMKTETREGKHHFEVEVFLNGLEPNAVRVELYADVASGGAPFRREMISAASAVAGPGGNLYTLEVSSERPLGDFTARVVPFFPGVAVPLEEGRILWRR